MSEMKMSHEEMMDANGTNGAARRTELEFRRMFQPAVGVAHVAPNGRFLMASPALLHILGYSRSELLSKTEEEITHPDDRARDAALFTAMLNGGDTSYKTEKCYLCRGGRPVWATETCSAVEDNAGSLLYRICLIQIDERKQAEGHFRLVVESATSALVLLNQEGKIVLVNSHMEKLFGYARGELLGKPVTILVARSSKKSHKEILGRLMSQLNDRAFGTTWNTYGRRKNGTYFPANLGLNAVHTHTGTWILSSVVDMTERKWSEASLPHTRAILPGFRPAISEGRNARTGLLPVR